MYITIISHDSTGIGVIIKGLIWNDGALMSHDIIAQIKHDHDGFGFESGDVALGYSIVLSRIGAWNAHIDDPTFQLCIEQIGKTFIEGFGSEAPSVAVAYQEYFVLQAVHFSELSRAETLAVYAESCGFETFFICYEYAIAVYYEFVINFQRINRMKIAPVGAQIAGSVALPSHEQLSHREYCGDDECLNGNVSFADAHSLSVIPIFMLFVRLLYMLRNLV
jgi:hypothetical protein